MRAGACTVQQTLTSEAASVLRHSLGLAKRRGHAQVTPLHVAATLLSPRCSLLRRACLKSHPHSTSHPLQCRALELCFNVALNRLPTTPGPFLHGQPSLSNALIAALKRAQAHQRRGCIEQQQQQQPLLAIKVALEQLIISILDDPSVSRVMREAGFSSTSVKNNLEDSSASSVFQCYSSSSSGGILSSTCSPPIETQSSFWQTHLLNCYSEQNPLVFSPPKKPLVTINVPDSATGKEDLRLVLEVLMRKKRRNTVIVGDSVSTAEGLIAELMGKMERGEVPDELRSAHFIKFQISPVSLRFMKREDMEMKVSDLRRKVGSLITGGGGAIIYAGDLKWVADGGVGDKEGGFSAEVSSYNATNHLVTEIGRLLSDYSCSNSKVWLMAISNYQTYMRCQLKQPSLETRWTLQAVSVPSGGLGLSLHASIALDSKVAFSPNRSLVSDTKPLTPKEEPDNLTCCAECNSNFEKEAAIFKSGQQNPTASLVSSCISVDMVKGSTSLPYWLQPFKGDTHLYKGDLVELKKRWNRLCHSLHHPRSNQIPHHKHLSLFNNQNSSGKSYTHSTSYPWWPSSSQYNQASIFPESTSISFTESMSETNHITSIATQMRSHQSCTIEFGFTNEETWELQRSELSLDSLKSKEIKEVKTTLALGNPVFSDSLASRVQEKEGKMEPRDICKVLQENIPWQSGVIPSIAEALIDSSKSPENGNWLLIRGMDCIGKRRLALATAESICGSTDYLVCLNKRRENEKIALSEILIETLKEHPKCVFLLEDIDSADSDFIKFLADGLKTKDFKDMEGRDVCFSQATFIATIGGGSSSSFINSKEDGTVIQLKLQFEEDTTSNPAFEMFNSDHKRKAEWNLPFKNKQPRNEEKEHSFPAVEDTNGGDRRAISRQSSCNTLDLNIQAEEEEEDDEDENKPDNSNSNPNPSDLTQETATDLHSPHGSFLGSIEKSFLFDRNSEFLDEMSEIFLSKIKESFHEVCGSEVKISFSVDKVVLNEMVSGCGSFLNSLFEIWLKDIFQTSLGKIVKERGKEGNIKLKLFGAKGENILGSGFKGSNLPKTVQVVFKDLATGLSM